jgi:hypothetical protein
MMLQASGIGVQKLDNREDDKQWKRNSWGTIGWGVYKEVHMTKHNLVVHMKFVQS